MGSGGFDRVQVRSGTYTLFSSRELYLIGGSITGNGITVSTESVGDSQFKGTIQFTDYDVLEVDLSAYFSSISYIIINSVSVSLNLAWTNNSATQTWPSSFTNVGCTVKDEATLVVSLLSATSYSSNLSYVDNHLYGHVSGALSYDVIIGGVSS